jgi:hypothetical protein
MKSGDCTLRSADFALVSLAIIRGHDYGDSSPHSPAGMRQASGTRRSALRRHFRRE